MAGRDNVPPRWRPATMSLLYYLGAPSASPTADATPATSLMGAPSGSTPAVAPLPRPSPVHSYPRQSMERTYPLTKSRSKQIKIGLDVTTFTPFILLQGDKKKNMFARPTMPITPGEFDVLVSNEFHSQMLCSLDSQIVIPPVAIGDLTLSLNKTNPNFRSVVFERKDFSVKIFLGTRSWTMIKTAKDIMMDRLIKIHHICMAASLNLPALLAQVKQTLAANGFKSDQTIKSLPFNKLEQIIRESLEFFPSAFPEVLKKELIYFHSDIIRDKLIASLQQ